MQGQVFSASFFADSPFVLAAGGEVSTRPQQGIIDLYLVSQCVIMCIVSRLGS